MTLKRPLLGPYRPAAVWFSDLEHAKLTQLRAAVLASRFFGWDVQAGRRALFVRWLMKRGIIGDLAIGLVAAVGVSAVYGAGLVALVGLVWGWG